MIALAACSTRGVKIPDRKQTQRDIISIFKEQMTALKECLSLRQNSLYFSHSNIDSRANMSLGKLA